MKKALFLLILLSLPLAAWSRNLRKIDSWDGLSNSSVLSLWQDSDRYLWIGTFDGLDRYDGVAFRTWKPAAGSDASLSGNVIRSMLGTPDGIWVLTKGGLNHLTYGGKVVRVFREFHEDCLLGSDSRGLLYVLSIDGTLRRFDRESGSFVDIPLEGLPHEGNVSGMFVDEGDRIWVLKGGSVFRCGKSGVETVPHGSPVVFLDGSQGSPFIIDADGVLWRCAEEGETLICRFGSAAGQGGYSDIACEGDEIFVSHREYGVFRMDISALPARAEKVPIGCGAFSLLVDPDQGILWIGTDGQGVYSYSRDEFSFGGMVKEDMGIEGLRPVRAIYPDEYGNLWIGTKGNGILRISGWQGNGFRPNGTVSLLNRADGLSHDNVFKFTPDPSRGVLWIGTEGPHINYWSYGDGKMHTLAGTEGYTFADTHNILVDDDLTLWVTSGHTLYHIRLGGGGSRLRASGINVYSFALVNGEYFNKIFTMIPDGPDSLWLGVRGNGLIHFNKKDGTYRSYDYSQDIFTSRSDVLAIYGMQGGNLWLGTSYGLMEVGRDGGIVRTVGVEDGLGNNTVHGILPEGDDRLWLSTNDGISLFRISDGTVQTFRHGLKVNEFTDNAYFKDASGRSFFGGVDGIVWITDSGEIPGNGRGFVPKIICSGLQIHGEEVDMANYLSREGNRTVLTLGHKDDFFSLSFTANDFLDCEGREFLYKMGDSGPWISSVSRKAAFTKLSPGSYPLKVVYGNDRGSPLDILIRIRHPWYSTIAAKAVYSVMLLLLAAVGVLLARRAYRLRRDRLSESLRKKYEEDTLHAKIRFFTNVTHELCTPLTLIHTPCERIMEYEGSDDTIRRYAAMIKDNSTRLNTLVQEIIDFRKIETGSRKADISTCDVGAIASGISKGFSELAVDNSINYTFDAPSSLIWNTNQEAFASIIENLVSNAFKYTHRNGEVRFCMGIENGVLEIEVANTGSGIRKEDVSRLFDSFSVLDNVKENTLGKLTSRNGLGLAITKSSVEMLNGSIDVRSELGKFASFMVHLPYLGAEGTSSSEDYASGTSAPAQRADGRGRILVVDDNGDILWLMREMLLPHFYVETATDGNMGYQKLLEGNFELLITDIMMEEGDGIAMIRRIKENRFLVNIPIIVVSAKTSLDDKVEGLNAGADAYFTKPFEEKLLMAMVHRLIAKHVHIKEYYDSSLDAYEYLKGNIVGTEDREFIGSCIQVVENHISDEEFGQVQMAEELGVSSRTLYRRFSELSLGVPNDFIKRQRMDYAAKLLRGTSLTIQEIVYESGFRTRSNFYREFSKIYNCSPSEFRNDHSNSTGAKNSGR